MLIKDEYLEMMREHRTLPANSPPIQLFPSRWLETFTHTPVLVVPAVWLPIALWYFVKGVKAWPATTPWIVFPAMLAFGAFLVWTLVEYVVHRWVFHYEPKSKWQAELIFIFHGIHHVQPHTPTRLVLPLSVSVPLGLLFIAFFHHFYRYLGHEYLAYPTLVGFAVGYVAYDVLHYWVHHWPTRWGWLKKLKRHHMEHHFKTPDQRFGVSSDAWDHVFGTLPER